MGTTLLVMTLSVIAGASLLMLSEKNSRRSKYRPETFPPGRRQRRRDFKDFKDRDDDFLFDDEDDFLSDFSDDDHFDLKSSKHRRSGRRRGGRKSDPQTNRIIATIIFVTLLMLLFAFLSSL